MNLDTARRQMIGQQLRAWDVVDNRVLDVMDELPREQFIPPRWRGLAYADASVPLGPGRELPPPKLQGRALQALLPTPGDRILEIGAGTGYLTACLARLGRHVTAFEADAALAATARDTLAALGIDNVELHDGDGLETARPGRYDVICVNGSLPTLPDRLPAALEIGGRLFVVTGRPPIMTAQRITRAAESEWQAESLFETCLPPLASAQAKPEFSF